MKNSTKIYLELIDYIIISFTSAVGLGSIHFYLFDGLLFSGALGLVFGIAVMALLIANMYRIHYDLVPRGEDKE